MPETEPMPCELTACPLCGRAAEVVWRADLPSTDGLLPHVKVQCVQRHWFVGPEDTLAMRPARLDDVLTPAGPSGPPHEPAGRAAGRRRHAPPRAPGW